MLRRLIKRLESFLPEKPRTVHISPTYRCTLKCMQCDLWRLPNRGELNAAQWMDVVRAFRQYLGPFALKISGGEPFCVKGIMDLVEMAKSMDIYVGISTNGTLVDDDVARRIVSLGVDEVHVSLDSLDPAVHDEIRGVPGTHERVMQALDRLSAYDGSTKLCLATVVTSLNLDGLPGMVRWTEEHPGLYTITLQALFQNFGAPYDPGWWTRSRLWPRDRQDVAKVFGELIEYKSSSWVLANPPAQLEAMRDYFLEPDRVPTAVCHAGRTDIAVDPYGGLRLCFSLPAIGNLLERGPGDLLSSREAAKRRRQIASCRRSCNLLNCNYDQESGS